jgi:hypothetical protein
MTYPPFEKVTFRNFEKCIQEFFLENLSYYDIENDPDDKDASSDKAWRMVIPAENSRPFAIAFQAGLSEMPRQRVSRLYIERVIPHRDGSPSVDPALYGFTDGARYVFFSADPARNRDDRFDLSPATWGYAGVGEKYKNLHRHNLQFKMRLNREIPQVDFLFESSPLSADDRFKRYMDTVRVELMQAVIRSKKALGEVVFHLLETPQDRKEGETRYTTKDRKLKKNFEELHLEIGMRLGDAVAAAVDTLLLRSVMLRFLEAYHPEALDGLLKSDELLQKGKAGRRVAAQSGKPQATLFIGEEAKPVKFSDDELQVAEILSRSLAIDVAKAKRKAKGSDQMLFDIYSFDDPKTGAETFLSEEDKRELKLGGDFYLADLGCAARAIEAALFEKMSSHGSLVLQDFLGRTGNPDKQQWSFRYEDLRPQTLQNYYESSLGTAVQLTYNKKSGEFDIDVGKSRRQRKELGAYYTDSRLCRFMVERTVKPLFEDRLEKLRQAIGRKDPEAARNAFDSIVTLSICDPTMGSAPFLRSAFDFLSEKYLTLCGVIREAKESLLDVYTEISKGFPFLAAKGGVMDENGVGRWEWYILRRMLYGVDIDLKAVCIACQTFALSALKYLKQGERFPSFFNINLKLGNALISPVKLTDRQMLADKFGKKIKEMIQLRRKAATLKNTEEAYKELLNLLEKIDEIKRPIVQELVQENVAPILQEFTEDLRPFCWELEFPEVFFTDEGRLKSDAGFDVMIGNPPWEAIKINDNEFLDSINADFDDLETVRKKHKGVDAAYSHYCGEIESWKGWVSAGGQYEHQQGGRDRNKWRLTTEVAWKLTQPQGEMSLVVPSGIIADEGGAALKKWIFPEGEAGTFISFDKSNDVFSGTQGFTIMSFRKGCPTSELKHLQGLTDAEQLTSWPYNPIATELLLVEKLSPGVLAIPSIQDEIDHSLLEKLYRHPLIVDETASWYARTVSYDYHMGHGREDFRRGGKIPLLEGKSIEQYEVHPLSEIRIHVPERHQYEPDGQYRIASAEVAGALDPRRMLCAFVPHGYATGHKLNCFLVDGNDAIRLFLVGMLNSFVIEWRVRQLARNNVISKFMLTQLPIPRPENIYVENMASMVASLATTDERFSDLRQWLNGRKPEKSAVKRHELKCRIDAEVARLFGLNEAELDRVLEEFDKVPEETKQMVKRFFVEA